MSLETIVLAVVLALMSVLFHFIPNLTRPDLFFAVTIAPEFRRTSDGRRILRIFRLVLWTSIAAAIAVELASGMVLVAFLIQAAGYLAALVIGHHWTLAFAATPPSTIEVDLSAPVERLPGRAILVSLPVLALAGLAVWASANWERLPQRFPVHWDFHGPDRWVLTTPSAIYGFLAMQALLCMLMAGSAWGLLHWSRRISTSGARAAAERHFRKLVVQLMIVAEYFIAGPAFFALFAASSVAVNVWAVALAAVIVAFAIRLIRAGQGGVRKIPADIPPAGDRTPDECWKWGVLYFNPADPSIFIEKRFGVGYTMNFGNCWSWAVLALLLVPLTVGMLLLRS